MTNQHPITPPPELVEEWTAEAMKGWRTNGIYEQDITTQAARWGADQELEACVEWVRSMFGGHPTWADELRTDRRPKPPSLKEQALEALREAESSGCLYVNNRSDIIRRALEALPND